MRTFPRSEMLALSAAALAAASAPVAAQETATIRFGTVGVEEAALPYYAQEQGFFKAAGLDVALTVFPNGGSVTQGLAGGAIDVGVTNSGSMSLAHVRGLPIVLVACGALYSPAAPIAYLVVGKESGIRSARDLSGKTIGVSTLSDMIQASVMAWIDQNGGDSKAVRFIENPMSAMIATIGQRRIDGAAVVEPFYTNGKDDVTLLARPYEAVAHNRPFQTLGIVANKTWVDRNTATARRLARALGTAARWANRNHARCATLLASFTKMQPAIVDAIPRLEFAESNDPRYVQPVIDLLLHYNILPSGFPAAQLFAT